VCEEGECRYRPGRGLGEPCSFDSPIDSERCWMAMCLNGVCTEPPGLGAACAQECPWCDPACLAPFQCVEGVCKDFPACAAGPDQPCIGDPDCLEGYYCNDSDYRCKPGKVELGQRCVPEGGCSAGACENGRCVFQEIGAACSDDDACASRSCQAGRCAAPAC
jgi:hypothetical protein